MGWLTIDTAPENERIRVGHDLDPSSMKPETICPTFGTRTGEEWSCNNAFVCIDGFLRWNPTHWLPEQAHEARSS